MQQALAEPRYCAFLDLLGTTARLENFEDALHLYRVAMENVVRESSDRLAETNKNLAQMEGNINSGTDPSFSATVISDSIIVSGSTSMWVVPTTFQIARNALLNGFLLRGALSYGQHYERHEGNHCFILSEAFVRAYELETKRVKYPRVVLDPEHLDKFERSYSPKDDKQFSIIQCDDELWCLNVLPHSFDLATIGYICLLIMDNLNSIGLPTRQKEKWAWLGDYFNMVIWGREGTYEKHCEPSFRQYLAGRVDHLPVGLQVPMWQFESFPEAKFYLSKQRRHNRTSHDFERSFKDNYDAQLIAI